MNLETEAPRVSPNLIVKLAKILKPIAYICGAAALLRGFRAMNPPQVPTAPFGALGNLVDIS